MGELLSMLRGSGLLTNPVYFVSVAMGLAVLLFMLRRGFAERLIWAAAVALSLLIAVFVFMMSVHSPPFLDFTRAYWDAGYGVLSGWEGLEPLYDRQTDGFVNLPILAYLFTPFALFNEETATLIFNLLGIVLTFYAWWKIVEVYEFDLRARVISLFLLAAFGPLIYSVREANTSHFLLLPLVLGVVSLRQGKDMRAGAWIAAAALIKPVLLLIGAMAFVRGRFKLALGGGLVVLGATLLSLIVFGWSAHVHWYEELIRPFTGAPLPAFNSQSIASSLSRFERGPADYWIFTLAPLSDASRIVLYGVYAALFAALLWAVRPWRNWRATDREFEGEMMLALILALLVSTLSWTHYFAMALLPAAWLWREIRDGALGDKLVFALTYILGAPIVFYGARMGAGDFGPAYYVLGSHVCVAGLILFALLAKTRRAGTQAAAIAS